MKTTTKQEKYRTHAMQNLRIEEITHQLKAGLTVYEASPIKVPNCVEGRGRSELFEKSLLNHATFAVDFRITGEGVP